MKATRAVAGVLAIMSTSSLLACGSAQVASTVTSEVTTTETTRAPAATSTAVEKPAATKPSCTKVPSVVGHNHQAAQDEMQAAGFYTLDETDATGQGRMLVWDRNWQVVSQTPPAGTCTSTDTTVTLSSKKIGE